jgi:hypothetical protein
MKDLVSLRVIPPRRGQALPGDDADDAGQTLVLSDEHAGCTKRTFDFPAITH